MSEKMREALLKCKTCALPTEVRDLVIAALAEQPDREKYSPFANSESSVETHAGSRQPAQGEAVDSMGMPISCGKPLCSVNDHHPLCRLYAAPLAPSLPDEIEGDTDWNDDFDQGYREGWNACRAATLASAPEPRS